MDWTPIRNFFFSRMQLANTVSNALAPMNIALQNENFNRPGSDIWFELIVTPGPGYYRTPGIKIYQGTANHTICIPVNTGIERLNNYASRIADLYSPVDKTRGIFVVNERKIYITDVEQLGHINVNEVLKSNVRVTFEIMEEMA